MTAPNAELAYRVLDHIDAYPEHWQQGVWIMKAECGTVACFAGLVCLLSGEQPDFESDSEQQSAHLVGGWSVPSRAGELLRASRYLYDLTLDFEDGRDLFKQSNTREQLGEYVAKIFGPRPAAQGAAS